MRDEKIDESVLPWFVYIERMGNDAIYKRLYIGECMGRRSVGRSWKRWIASANDRLKYKKVWRLGRKSMMHDRNEWHGCLR